MCSAQPSPAEEKGVTILQEGKIRKLVDSVSQISFNGPLAIARGQNMWYVTERCVFRLTSQGMMLTEVAKGIDLQKDILDQMDFVPLISENLAVTDTRIYRDGPFGIGKLLRGR